MPNAPEIASIEKNGLHPRNKNRFQYDFEQLCKSSPELIPCVYRNKYGNDTIDFSDPTAVKNLNKAILALNYGIKFWDIPPNYLCPPIPGRADYIHYLADLLSSTNNGNLAKGHKIKILDLGTGANFVYPLIGYHEYSWNFVASDIDSKALNSARKIIDLNNFSKNNFEIRQQENCSNIFKGIIYKEEKFDLTMCNPPFHSSKQEAENGNNRKNKNLGLKNLVHQKLNFAGQSNELWCEGGEVEFIKKMAYESLEFSKNCLWFTSLVSKKSSLPSIYSLLKKLNVAEIKTIEMAQGQKISRFVAWTFLDQKEKLEWITKWNN